MNPPTPAPFTCQDSVALVSALRDGELSPPDAVRLDHHVAQCPRCQVARKQFTALFAALDSLLPHPA